MAGPFDMRQPQGLGRIVGHNMAPRRSAGLGGMRQTPTPAATTPAVPAMPTATPATPATPAAPARPPRPVQRQTTDAERAEQLARSNELSRLSFLASGATEGPGGAMTMGGAPVSNPDRPAPAPEWQQARNAQINSGAVERPAFLTPQLRAQVEPLMAQWKQYFDQGGYNLQRPLTDENLMNFALQSLDAQARMGRDPRLDRLAPQSIAVGEPNPAAPPPAATMTAQQQMNALKAEIQQLKEAQGGVLTAEQEARYGPLWDAAFQAAKVAR